MPTVGLIRMGTGVTGFIRSLLTSSLLKQCPNGVPLGPTGLFRMVGGAEFAFDVSRSPSDVVVNDMSTKNHLYYYQRDQCPQIHT